MNIWRSLTASSSFALILTLWAPAQADLIKADVVGFSSTGGAPFNLTSELAGPGPFSSPSASVAIVSPTEPFTFVEGPCAGVLCVQSTAHPVIGPGPSMSLSGNLDSFVLPPCFDLCGRSLSVNGTFVFDDFVITSADPSIRVVETSFNALLKGSVFVFAINPGTEAFAHVGVRLLASDCSDTPSQFYESCARGGNLIQVAQNNNLTLVARNTTGPLSTVGSRPSSASHLLPRLVDVRRHFAGCSRRSMHNRICCRHVSVFSASVVSDLQATSARTRPAASGDSGTSPALLTHT